MLPVGCVRAVNEVVGFLRAVNEMVDGIEPPEPLPVETVDSVHPDDAELILGESGEDN